MRSLRSHCARPSEQGYVLLTLIWFVALLTILALAWVEKIDFQLKRDREEEMIHRGVQYSRAVRRYFKKFGHYPTRIEELESTNRVRFLRKRYKDPITGKDFKPLHMTDIQISFSPGVTANSLPPGPGRANFVAFQAATAAANSPVASPGSAAAGTNQMPESAQVADQAGGMAQAQPNPAIQSNAAGNLSQPAGAQQAVAGGPAGDGTSAQTQVFGGGAIVGVASTSKEKSIRQFNQKDHYNQWQFIYDPATDRGGLLMTPNQPALQGAVASNQPANPQPAGNPQNPYSGVGAGNAASPGQTPPSQAPAQQPPQP